MNAEDAIGMADAAFGEQESSPGKHPVDGGAPQALAPTVVILDPLPDAQATPLPSLKLMHLP